MKKDNIIITLVVLLVVLIAAMFVEAVNSEKEIIFVEFPAENHQNIKETTESGKENISYPNLPQQPLSVDSCEKYLAEYSCEKVKNLPLIEGRPDCNPTYSRSAVECRNFLEINAKIVTDALENKNSMNLSFDVYTLQPAYITGYIETAGLGVVSVDIVTSYRRNVLGDGPESGFEEVIVNQSFNERNFSINQQTLFHQGGGDHNSELIQFLAPGNFGEIIFISTDDQGQVLELLFPSAG